MLRRTRSSSRCATLTRAHTESMSRSMRLTASSAWLVERRVIGRWAMSVSSKTARFAPGAAVRLKASGRRGLVHRVSPAGETFHYEVLLFGDPDTTVYAEEYLTVDVEDDSVLGRLKSWTFLEADTFRQALTVLKLRRPLQQNLYSYLAS